MWARIYQGICFIVGADDPMTSRPETKPEIHTHPQRTLAQIDIDLQTERSVWIIERRAGLEGNASQAALARIDVLLEERHRCLAVPRVRIRSTRPVTSA